MTENIDRITEPQEWIDGLLKRYAPNSKDVDVALQNMGLKIKALESLARSVSCSEYEGTICHDIDNKNWFDFRNDIL